VRAGEVLGRLLSDRRLKPGLLAGRVLWLWPRVAGEGIARLTEPFRFQRGVLWVRAKDAVLAHQLTYQRALLLKRYAHHLGEGVVRELRFVVGPVRRPPPEAEKVTPPPPALAAARLEALTRDLKPPLKAAALRLGAAVLARAQILPACPVCQGPSEGGVCPSCRQRIESPLVRAEAERLLAGRPPRLAGDLLAAARYRALEALWSEIAALLPEATRAPEAVPRLLDRTLRWLELKHGRPPRLEDLNDLPGPLRSLLRRRLGGA